MTTYYTNNEAYGKFQQGLLTYKKKVKRVMHYNHKPKAYRNGMGLVLDYGYTQVIFKRVLGFNMAKKKARKA